MIPRIKCLSRFNKSVNNLTSHNSSYLSLKSRKNINVYSWVINFNTMIIFILNCIINNNWYNIIESNKIPFNCIFYYIILKLVI